MTTFYSASVLFCVLFFPPPLKKKVDGKSLQGFSNHQAVEVLKNTGQMVRLKLVRFRHGPKYDKLQEYLGRYYVLGLSTVFVRFVVVFF